MKTLTFHPRFSRRFPDPLNFLFDDNRYNIEHHLFVCQINKLPMNVPKDPNPREQNIFKSIYKDIKKSLLLTDDFLPSFHLKNKGITIIASSIVHNEKDKSFEVIFKPGDGIVDGGHTYSIIEETIKDCPDNQFIKIEILTGVPKDLIVDIARGLNTSVQVQRMSLANLDNKFDWIKKELEDELYSDEIAYKENEDGSYSIRDIISFLTLFNIDLFPQNGSHPKIAYTSKEECLKRYLDNEDSYKKLQPIMKDIFELHDYIQLHSHSLYNKKYNGKGRALAFYQSKPRSTYKYVFVDEESSYKLFDGAMYPILGAFRCLVEEDKSGKYRWKTKSFSKVKKIFDSVGADLINVTKNTSDNWGKNPNAIGKDESNWDNLYKTVAISYLMNKE